MTDPNRIAPIQEALRLSCLLAPVVAYQIITAFGGEIRLIKGEGNNGTLEAIFSAEQIPQAESMAGSAVR
jgi:hypothetical protein